jgi:hypothetical protein
VWLQKEVYCRVEEVVTLLEKDRQCVNCQRHLG